MHAGSQNLNCSTQHTAKGCGAASCCVPLYVAWHELWVLCKVPSYHQRQHAACIGAEHLLLGGWITTSRMIQRSCLTRRATRRPVGNWCDPSCVDAGVRQRLPSRQRVRICLQNLLRNLPCCCSLHAASGLRQAKISVVCRVYWWHPF